MNPAPLLAVLLGLAASAPYSPRVTAALPAGGQRGTEVEVTLRGDRLDEPLGLVGETDGIEVLSLASPKPDRCVLHLRFAADAALGARLLRLHTSEGLTNAFQLRVGALPQVLAAGGDAAQQIACNSTVDGDLPAGAEHRFAVALAAAADLTFEVEAMRLGFAASDLALAVAGPDGRVWTADDSTLGLKDPLLTIAAAAPGTYTATVRGAYAGPQDRGVYRLHVGTFPRPLVALPCGGAAGATVTVQLRGGGAEATATVLLPNDADTAAACYPQVGDAVAPTPVFLRSGGPPDRAPTPDAAGRAFVELPGSVHGVLAEPGAVGTFWFHADKDRTLLLRAFARSLRSPLDPLLVVRDAKGRYLASNDDQNGLGLDSQLRFQVPATGDFRVDVRDLLRSGSTQHVYRLEFDDPAEAPSLRLSAGRREEAALEVPQGGAIGRTLQFGGIDPKLGLKLLARDLPPGVAATFGAIQRGTNLVPMLLTAAEDAPLQGRMVGFTLRAEGDGGDRDPGYAQDLTLVTVGNDQPLVHATQRALPVAVIRRAPFALELLAPAVPIARGAPLPLRIKVHRTAGNKDRLRVRALWTPPGINAGQCVVEPDRDEAELPLSADAGALLGTFPFAVIATAGRRDNRLEIASGFVPLAVAAAPVSAKLPSVRTQPGGAVEVRVPVTAKDVAGPWQAQLIALPRGVTAAAVELAADATEAVFSLQIAADAAPGRHRGWLFEARVPVAADAIVCRSSGGELRIDAAVAGGER